VTEQERANGLLAGISERLIRVLPPAFLMLIVLNIVFLGVFWWVFDHNVSARTELLNRIVEKCLLRP
jgi:Na+-transporting NADH:ubiquinone oxidoreductase subunit NqrB